MEQLLEMKLRKNISSGNLISNNYIEENLEEPYIIEDQLQEKKAPSRNTCRIIGSLSGIA
jgi:hypothetical protein